MYLGHICTLVLLPSCHPHRLSYQAFMSRRTKYLSPGHFSPCKADMTFDFYVWLCLFPWHYRDTEYPFPRHARLVCALLSIRSGLWFCIYTRHAFALWNPLWNVCAFEFTLSCVPYLTMALYAFIWNTDLWEFISSPFDCYVHWTCFPCLWLKLAFLLGKKEKEIWKKKALLNYTYFWKLISRVSI